MSDEGSKPRTDVLGLTVGAAGAAIGLIGALVLRRRRRRQDKPALASPTTRARRPATRRRRQAV